MDNYSISHIDWDNIQKESEELEYIVNHFKQRIHFYVGMSPSSYKVKYDDSKNNTNKIQRSKISKIHGKRSS